MTNDNDESIRSFAPGSILSMRLKNFLTYTYVYFECGKALNFVLGPNGSGKSSLVSAICLGLGGDPERTLFRADTVKGFIRHGQSKAVIEITLKGRGDMQIHRIRRILSDDDSSKGKSEWRIDGKTVSGAKVKELVEDLEIRVDNLCNFLPQERVHHFARRKPAERLIDTMKSVGGAAMVNQHEDLVQFQVAEAEVMKRNDELSKELDSLAKQNANIETEVRRFEEREQIMEKIDNIKKKLPWMHYSVAREENKIAKVERNKAKAEYLAVESKANPIKEKIKFVQEELSSLEQQKSVTDRASKKASNDLANVERDLSTTEGVIDDVRAEITAYHKEVEGTRERIANCEKELAQVESIVKRGRPEVPMELNEKIDQVSHDIRESGSDLHNVQDNISNAERNLRSLEQSLNARSLELGKLDDLQYQRVRELERMNPHVHHAYMWLKDNQHTFKYEVSGPIVLDINVRDARYSDAIENSIKNAVLHSFVTRCQEDTDRFMSICQDRNKWMVSAIQLDGPNHRVSDYRPRHSREEITRLGFDCWLLDQLSGSEAVLTALCEHSHLHEIPAALAAGRVNDDDCNRAGLVHYISGNLNCYWKTSKYGAKMSTMTASRLRQAFRISGNGDDNELRQSLMQQIDAIKRDGKKAQKLAEEYRDKYEQLRKHEADLRAHKQTLLGKRDEFKKQITQFDRADTLKTKLRSELKRHQDIISAQTTLAPIKSRLKKALIKRVKYALEFQEKSIEAYTMSARANIILQLVEGNRKLSALNDEYREFHDSIKDAKDKYENACVKVDITKEKAQDLLAIANENSGSGDPGFAEAMAQLPDSIEELEDLQTREQAKLELTDDTDPVLVEMFKKRRDAIIEKTARLEDGTKRLAAMRAEISAVKTEWEERITTLIEKISESFTLFFSKINCSGAVRINRTNEDGSDREYATWGIDLLVKFRDNEDLAPLTALRQSGGERSVSIVLYLMALQSFSNSPFRVVDEINQGMDPRNERLIHRQIIETICEGDKNGTNEKSQYFLITPKLLPDLEYHENMKVLTVYNGEWLPEDEKWKSCWADEWTVAR